MAQKTKPRPAAPSRGKASSSSFRPRQAAIQLLLIVVLGTGAFFGLAALKTHVERDLAFPADPLIVVIKNRPAWMGDDVVQQIATTARPNGAHSAFDHQMLIDSRKALEADPWINRVNEVRRAYTNQPGDTLEIDCDFRVPAAWVRWGDYYWLVDRDGIKLPQQVAAAQLPADVAAPNGRINIRIIDGVRQPPPQAGQKWIGNDLAAGLEMAGVLFDRPYTEKILKIDVSNFAARQNPAAAQITLITQYGTSIFWGRAPSDPDAFIEIRPERKLQTLADIDQKFGRVDMKQPWIDIRFEGVRFPAPSSAASASLDNRR